jgi:hypothetical protein
MNKKELNTRMTAIEQLKKRINGTPQQSLYSNNWSVCMLILTLQSLYSNNWSVCMLVLSLQSLSSNNWSVCMLILSAR